jgi:hypothetical protein
MPDYGCYPLWWSGDEYGQVDFNEVSISEKTKKELIKWAKEFDNTLDTEDPRHSGFETQAQIDDFLKEGEKLFSQLKEELGENYEFEKNFASVGIKKNNFVIQTKPGHISRPHYGTELEKSLEKFGFFSKLNISKSVFKNVSVPPSQLDVLKLKDGLESGKFSKDEFSEFCKSHQFEENIESETSASRFLEFKKGKIIARLRVPVNDEYRIVSSFYQLTKKLELDLINSQTDEIVTI